MSDLALLMRLPFVCRQVIGAAAATSVSLQPPAGEQYILQEVMMYHDDTGVNHDLFLNINDGVTSVMVPVGAAVAPDVRVRLSSFLTFPIVIHPSTLLTLNCAAMTAAKHLVIEGIYYRVRGILGWNNL